MGPVALLAPVRTVIAESSRLVITEKVQSRKRLDLS